MAARAELICLLCTDQFEVADAAAKIMIMHNYRNVVRRNTEYLSGVRYNEEPTTENSVAIYKTQVEWCLAADNTVSVYVIVSSAHSQSIKHSDCQREARWIMSDLENDVWPCASPESLPSIDKIAKMADIAEQLLLAAIENNGMLLKSRDPNTGREMLLAGSRSFLDGKSFKFSEVLLEHMQLHRRWLQLTPKSKSDQTEYIVTSEGTQFAQELNATTNIR